MREFTSNRDRIALRGPTSPVALHGACNRVGAGRRVSSRAGCGARARELPPLDPLTAAWLSRAGQPSVLAGGSVKRLMRRANGDASDVRRRLGASRGRA
ncbi:unnamed protein product, partial [Iphiclides podalirius]